MLLPMIYILPLVAKTVTADPRLYDRPPLLTFEHNYHDAFAATDKQRRRDQEIDVNLCSASAIDPVSPLDLRVSKAHANHGYNAVRISVITYSANPPKFVRLGIDGSEGPEEEEDLNWDYSGAFKYRWTSQFDTGLNNTRCSSTSSSSGEEEEDGESASTPLLNSTSYIWGGFDDSPVPDSQCLFSCQDNVECKYYSFFWNSTSNECQCELFSSCESCDFTDTSDDLMDEFTVGEELTLAEAGPITRTTDIIKGSWTTVKKYGDSYMHTRLTTITPGIKNTFKVDDNEFDVKIPEEGKQAKCIIWGDPCISSKFVGCSFGKYFDAYEKSVKMLNSLAEADDGYDCFIMLGDNFYDSDGRISVSFWKRLTLKAMSKPIVYVLGNHDIWTGGSPSAGNYYDPLQYSLQYIGLDTVAGLDTATSTGNWFNYEIDPDDPPAALGTKYQSIQATSSISNSISWFMFGNLGVLYFNGAYDSSELSPYFEEACSFFGDNVTPEDTILLIGHWNGNATMQSWLSPYGGQLVTPDARSLMLSFPGCSQAGKRLIYFDGHGHANQQVEVDNGYLMGAHGIMGVNPDNFSVPVAAEYGFFYFETHSEDDKKPTELHYCQEIFSDVLPSVVSEFDPSTIQDDKYFAILDCLETNSGGIGDCLSFCEQWPYWGASSSSDELDSGTSPVSSPIPEESSQQPASASSVHHSALTLTSMAVLVLVAVFN